MRKYFFIMIGGAIGAILRFEIEKIQLSNSNIIFPVNTFIINIAGCFVLALFLSIIIEVMDFDPGLRLGVSVGLLGAFTTFSTLCKESVNLFLGREYFIAFSYIALSGLVGLFAVYIGNKLAKAIIGKLVLDDHNSNNLNLSKNEETR